MRNIYACVHLGGTEGLGGTELVRISTCELGGTESSVGLS